MGGGSDNYNQRGMLGQKKTHTRTFQALFLRQVVFTFYIIGI